MPTELLIAIVAFGVIPMGLMILAALFAYFSKSSKDPYDNPRNWGSQDTDRRNV